MIRNIAINLFFLLWLVSFCSCHSDTVHISSTEEIKNQTDSTRFKQVALSYNEGKQLFAKYCNTCHYVPDKDVLDQYLFDNLFERLPAPAEDYFIKYISDSKSLKASGNQYAKQVDVVWNSAYEHKFRDSLSIKDFSNLITYIKVAAKQRYQK
jgi:cytochrome c2